MNILIEANKSEGIANVVSKIITTLSDGTNMFAFGSDKSINAPCPICNLSFEEWDRFDEEMDKYIEKIVYSPNPFLNKKFLLIDARYISEDTLSYFLAKVTNAIGDTSFIIAKYKQ